MRRNALFFIVPLVLLVLGCETTTVSETANYAFSDAKSDSIIDSRLEKLRKDAETYPQRSDLRYQIAALCFEKGDFHECRKQLAEAIELEPGVSRYHYHMGRVLLAMQDLPGAATEFREAIRLQPPDRYSGPHAALGWTLARLKDVDGAIAQFQKCIEIEPDNTLHYYFLGSFYDMKNDRENAIHSFQEYLVRGGTKYRTKASELLKTMGVAVDELPRAAAPAKEEILFGPDPDEKG